MTPRGGNPRPNACFAEPTLPLQRSESSRCIPLALRFSARPLNPFQLSRNPPGSATTRRNLRRVDEERLDLDLAEDLVGAIDSTQGEGAILVFLPGMAEISALHARLAAARRFAAGAHWLVPLHSAVAPADQRRVSPAASSASPQRQTAPWACHRAACRGSTTCGWAFRGHAALHPTSAAPLSQQTHESD